MPWQPHDLPPDAWPGELKIKHGLDRSTGRSTIEALRTFRLGDVMGSVKEHSVWLDDGTLWHRDQDHQMSKPYKP